MDTPGHSLTSRPWMAATCLLLGAGVIANSVLGPLLLGVIEYRTSDSGEHQLTGADLATLVLVGPAAVVAGVLWLRGHWLAPVVSLMASAYAVYMFIQATVGIDYALYEGNNERFFPLHLALIVLGGGIAVRSWVALDSTHLGSITPRLRRVAGIVFLLSAAFLVLGLHVPSLLPVLRGEPTTDYLEIPAAFWVVKVMDLGLIAPIAVATGVGLLRGAPMAMKAAHGLSGWLTVLGAAVTAMSAVMQWRDDPEASAAFTVGFGVITIAFAYLAVALARSARPARQ